jgi:hypothetical protein
MADGQPSRLQEWLVREGFTSAQLEAESRIGRQSMTRIRGGGEVRRKTMLAILRAARALKGGYVAMDELFDLDPDSPFNREQ